MGLNYLNLDARTRALMAAEIAIDVQASKLYISDNLSPTGASSYPTLLANAAASGDDNTLAAVIRPLLNSHEKPRRLKNGGLSAPPIMRINAHEMLAEGEFNRFYIRVLTAARFRRDLTPTFDQLDLRRRDRHRGSQPRCATKCVIVGQRWHRKAAASSLKSGGGLRSSSRRLAARLGATIVAAGIAGWEG